MTNQAQHTPGPWEVYRSPSDKYAIWDCAPWPTQVPIAEILDGRYVGDKSRNARLIAAAPDLLAALERLVAADNCNYLVETMRYEGYFDAARAAIAKAKGELTP